MPKEKNYNPVQAQRKADKAKALKKGKAEVQGRRNEKLARKNPERIQKQIDDLKAISTSGGKLSKHEEQVLDGLEKELRSVKKAREALGDNAPSFGRSWNRDRGGGGGGGSNPNHMVLGKRRRGSQGSSSSGEDVPEEVRRIPMPRDTPPPIPKEVLDEWYAKRRAKRNAEMAARQPERSQQQHQKRDDEQDEGGDDNAERERKGLPPRRPPAAEPKTVYEAKPVMRDLRKEAVAAFVPSSVQMKMSKGQGQGGLLEPEEADRLEMEGYLKVKAEGEGAGEEKEARTGLRTVTVEDVEDEED